MPDSEGSPPVDPGDDAFPDETEIKPASARVSDSGRAKVRFTPGSMLADRYRIVALLGRGGMGEVYRAEDVKLGQQVALKFLPKEVASDRDKLARLYEEVRIGRQVSHPNVCRLYDVSEWEGNHFISMEYIDGEDLASLLRRIGKLPSDKALDIARDLCAGLAAAHGLGIVHRDLKPANVMIDGRGDARLTDFGLAALAEDLGPRTGIAGTPAYMAPEQLEGGEITAKTDLYALGLILYEMFTGKRLFEGKTLGEIVSQHKSSSSQSLSRDTGDLDPAVHRVIVRCLEDDPAKRPSSIHSVIASLPGGDPLQAAIDAGETPSPEMVAAAGSVGELEPRVAWPMIVATILVLIAGVVLSSMVWPIDLPREPRELAFRARDILAKAGVDGKTGDSLWAFGIDQDYRAWLRAQGNGRQAAAQASEAGFRPAIFGYRESPAAIATAMPGLPPIFDQDPAFEVPEMGAQVTIEPDGRLRRIIVAPPEKVGASRSVPDWATFFDLAGLDVKGAEETPPLWTPPVGADRRFAWLMPVPGLGEPLRIEAASIGGMLVWFEVMPPWKQPKPEGVSGQTFGERLGMLVVVTVILLLLIFGGVVAHRNLRRGRGDRQGAWRVASFVALCSMLGFGLQGHLFHDAVPELFAIMSLLRVAAFWALTTWIWYLALEPYLRRRWPRTLISWSRLLHGRWLDPLVGRDILIGIFGAACYQLVSTVAIATSTWMGRMAPVPDRLPGLGSWSGTVGNELFSIDITVFVSFLLLMVLLFAHLLVRRRAVAIAIVFVVAVMTFTSGVNDPLFEWVMRIAFGAVITWLMVRHGMVALAAFLVTAMSFIYTLDPSTWYFGQSLSVFVFLVGLAVFGFVRSLGSHALFAEPLLEE